MFVVFLILQILALSHNKHEIESRVHAIIDKFAERGLRSLAVARQVNSSTDFLCLGFTDKSLGYMQLSTSHKADAVLFSSGGSRWQKGKFWWALAIRRAHALI